MVFVSLTSERAMRRRHGALQWAFALSCRRRNHDAAVTRIAAASTNSAASALICGETPSRMLEKTTIGKVVAPILVFQSAERRGTE